MPTSHSESPRLGSLPTAMKPLWPLMLMSSTLARDSSSVLRSRPMGLPRYQEKEKCGPRMPPPASHWQPDRVPGGVDQSGDLGQLRYRLVADATALREHRPVVALSASPAPTTPSRPACCRRNPSTPATAGIRIVKADAARASAVELRRTATLLRSRLLLVTRCTVAAAQRVNHRHAA